jgi:hypothetical protein
MIFPPSENERIPAGHYQFRLNRDPELKKFTYQDKIGNEKEGRKIVLFAVGLNDKGQYQIRDEIATFDQRYADFLAAIGVEHSKDVTVQGAVFEADVIYEADRKDPLKSWPRLANIIASKGDDIPFS